MKRGKISPHRLWIRGRRHFIILSCTSLGLCLGYMERAARSSGTVPNSASRSASGFSDIGNHWAQASIQAVTDRQILQGYSDRTFRPDDRLTGAEFAKVMPIVFPNAKSNAKSNSTFQLSQPIPRSQIMAGLAEASESQPPVNPMETLQLYFEDAEAIPEETREAVAIAIQQDWVISYPDVRRFEPARNVTRGEMAAILCRVLKLTDAVPLTYATRSLGVYDLKNSVTVAYAQWRGSARLMRDIQALLAQFGLYPGDRINGEYSAETEQGLIAFCDFYGLPHMKTGVLDGKFGWSLTQADPIDYLLSSADRNAIYREFLGQRAIYSRGAGSSPYSAEIPQFPDRLSLKPDEKTPDGRTIVSLGDSLILKGTDKQVYFNPFPSLGTLPAIDQSGLDFLHPDITEACLCVGSFVNGELQTHWLGRNALESVELWSTTKIIAPMRVVSEANAVQPNAKMRDSLIRSIGSRGGHGFYNLAVDLVSYQNTIASSNAVAATFKQFFTPPELEAWLRNLTGNPHLIFRGRYGEDPLFWNPELWNQPDGKIILKPAYSDHFSHNALSTCDLARLMAMLGWHNHLPTAARLPQAKWDSLETLVRAMGTDTARYIDAAIDRLRIGHILQAPVILSKVGLGRSQVRNRTELCYVALVWFLDTRHASRKESQGDRPGNPAVLRTFSLALRAAKGLNHAGEETRHLDARMATEVTEILRRILTQELA
ncbi:S-layer homology domain-containing protein [Leptolyngbya ohadii]|uniref:S-layer homology domain-containing protein n=1 Tax=Leptolyngbya ohadii TaxID=1962290 RepID=UPI000B59A8A1|nr:S-layer homology domain-containing protein [Leptolyngbya ohadii]